MSVDATTTKPIRETRTLMQNLGHGILGLFGWRFEMIDPGTPKYVVIGAPHTSNWDFILMLFIKMCGQLDIRWIGKDSIFRGPMGPIMRALGGIPVNRRTRNNFVEQIATKFAESEALVIGIAPEGTRSKSHYWKSGFYYMAHRSNVPIVMGYLDYGNKRCGLGPSFMPCGDIDADFEIIRGFYKDIKGKFPNEQGIIGLDPTK